MIWARKVTARSPLARPSRLATTPDVAGVRLAGDLLSRLRGSPVEPHPVLVASVAADAAIVATRAPEPPRVVVSAPAGAAIAAELATLRARYVEVMHACLDAFERDDVRAMIDACEGLETLRARSHDVRWSVIVDAREHQPTWDRLVAMETACAMARRFYEREWRVPR